ncbi:hypothetical protein A3A60_04595 [Candidatus Curtissbacteria bacterium RIFCSPLOWO2_01_FULL_42_26]|uniref:PEGA domain-containing protein n=1 Tax=Candidatus Curtissbacteria bacterium RIFCSPLOWO2_01_FULL_42_26 TaxID=1797729 RepID=A0A1F5I4N9_9BACT|nr:MAG: hypothetical protein A3A60_04595 [Candidatus Curtissbacteria bacterium RIFCSPLOWO2_01_FULL_42_26]
MNPLSKHRTKITIVVFLLLAALGTVAIFWARGFKPNFKNGTIERTGLIVADSVPTGAQVYLDDRLTSATNTSIAFLEPKTYKVRIEKEGFTKWEKEVTVIADLATEIHALLFPLAPEIKPLTTTGASNPTLSPDGTKIVYGVGGERGGIYLQPMTETPFGFGQSSKILTKNTTGFDFSNAVFTWAPDSRQLIATFFDDKAVAVANLIIDADKTSQELRDITASLTATLSDWQGQIDIRTQTQAVLAPDEVKSATGGANLASPSLLPSPLTKVKNPTTQPASPAGGPSNNPTIQLNYYPTGLIFSPDEEKILYKNKENKYHVYDLKGKKDYTLPDFADFITISWYPDSAHLVVAQKDMISIIETDGNNKVTIYQGKFTNPRPPATETAGIVGRGFVFAHPSGTRLIILTTLTQQESTPANLYSINLR